MRRALIIIVLLVVTLVAAGKDGRELINAEVMAKAPYSNRTDQH